jgi:hypothetical protein
MFVEVTLLYFPYSSNATDVPFPDFPGFGTIPSITGVTSVREFPPSVDGSDFVGCFLSLAAQTAACAAFFSLFDRVVDPDSPFLDFSEE